MKKITLFACMLLTAHIMHAQPTQMITVTLAGDSIGNYSGDGDWSINSHINGPKDVCLDAAKNIYFTDHNNGVIRKISAVTGIITTIAGGGTSLSDGIAATAASISPNYVCVSASGALYMTTGNQVRKLSLSTGIISTIAGSASASGYSGDGGAATAALLDMPTGICADAANNVYFVDRKNNVVREIKASTGIISTIAGNASLVGYTGDGGAATAASLHAPACICADVSGNIYFSDQEPNYPTVLSGSVIRMIAAASHNISTVAGDTVYGATFGVPAINAYLGTVTGLCVDDSGDIYCNEMSCSCRRVRKRTGMMELVGGNFGIENYSDGVSSDLCYMSYPYGVCVDNAGTVYVADSGNNRIRKIIQLTNTPSFAFGQGAFIHTSPSAAGIPISGMFTVTDMDSAATETWTVISSPRFGTLTGFPASAQSGGDSSETLFPASAIYTPPTVTTIDQFKIKVSNGSGNSSVMTVYVEVGDTSLASALSVPGIATAGGISLFPNPASSLLHIAYDGLQGMNEVSVFDVTGKLYSNTAISNTAPGTGQMDISSFAPGIYFLSINGSEFRKFVKE